jgi:hypothetical protein
MISLPSRQRRLNGSNEGLSKRLSTIQWASWLFLVVFICIWTPVGPNKAMGVLGVGLGILFFPLGNAVYLRLLAAVWIAPVCQRIQTEELYVVGTAVLVSGIVCLCAWLQRGRPRVWMYIAGMVGLVWMLLVLRHAALGLIWENIAPVPYRLGMGAVLALGLGLGLPASRVGAVPLFGLFGCLVCMDFDLQSRLQTGPYTQVVQEASARGALWFWPELERQGVQAIKQNKPTGIPDGLQFIRAAPQQRELAVVLIKKGHVQDVVASGWSPTQDLEPEIAILTAHAIELSGGQQRAEAFLLKQPASPLVNRALSALASALSHDNLAKTRGAMELPEDTQRLPGVLIQKHNLLEGTPLKVFGVVQTSIVSLDIDAFGMSYLGEPELLIRVNGQHTLGPITISGKQSHRVGVHLKAGVHHFEVQLINDLHGPKGDRNIRNLTIRANEGAF